MQHITNIFGAISPVKSDSSYTLKDLQETLSQMAPDDTLLCYVNSPGGDVFEGIAIANKLRELGDRLTIKIIGRADSIASVIICASNNVIAMDNTSALLHKPWTLFVGDEDDLNGLQDELGKVKDQILISYINKSILSSAELDEILSQKKRHNAAQLKYWGFVDRIEKPVKAEKKLIDYSATIYNTAILAMNIPAELIENDNNENIINVSQIDGKDSSMDPNEILQKLAGILDKSATQEIKAQVDELTAEFRKATADRSNDIAALSAERDALKAEISAQQQQINEQQQAISAAAVSVCKAEVNAFIKDSGIPESQQAYISEDLTGKYADKTAFAAAKTFYADLYKAHQQLTKPLDISAAAPTQDLPASYFNATAEEKAKVSDYLKELAAKNNTSFTDEFNRYIQQGGK